MNEVIRNVEWFHADTKKTVFEYLHPVTKEWRKKMINGFFERGVRKTIFLMKSKNNRGTECSRTDAIELQTFLSLITVARFKRSRQNL